MRSNAMLAGDDAPWATAAPEDEPFDYTSRDGAQALKGKIEAYWRERGLDVMLSLHNVGFHPAIRAARYDLRSDMINGLPRRAAPAPLTVASDRTGADEDSVWID